MAGLLTTSQLNDYKYPFSEILQQSVLVCGRLTWVKYQLSENFKMFFSFHQFSVNNTFALMEFYMVWNTSTTNDFPNVARGLKIKILASNLFL